MQSLLFFLLFETECRFNVSFRLRASGQYDPEAEVPKRNYVTADSVTCTDVFISFTVELSESTDNCIIL